MNNKLYFDLTCLKAVLARNFGFLTLIPFLARSFCRIQGLGRIQNGAVLLYREYLNLGRKRSSRKKNPLKKTKPKQTQNKPKQSQFFGGFWRKNFNFSLKIDDTKLNFLCKTNPIYFCPAPKKFGAGLMGKRFKKACLCLRYLVQ